MFEKRHILYSVVFLCVFSVTNALLRLIVQMLIAAKFGVSASVDAYLIAVTFPNIVGDFLIGGIALLAFIPVFVEYKTKKGEAEAWLIANSLINLIVLVLLLVWLIYYILTPLWVRLLAPGFKSKTYFLAVSLMRLISPVLVFFGMSAMLRAIFQTYLRFITQAWVPLIFSTTLIASLLFFSERFGIYSLAGGVICGAILALVTLFFILIKFKGGFFKFAILWQHSGFRKVLRLFMPVISLVLVYNLSVIIMRFLASLLEAGRIAALNFAMLISHFPAGTAVAALGVVFFPIFSQQVAENNFYALKKSFLFNLKTSFFISIPFSVIFMIMRTPIVRLLFERGAFDHSATILTAGALFYFSLSLFSLAGNMIIMRVFYSMQDMVTPLKAGIISLVIHLFFSITLMYYMDINGLALAFSISATSLFFIQLFYIRQKLQLVNLKKVWFSLVKISLASLVMGIVIYFISDYIRENFDLKTTQNQFLHILIAVFFGGITFIGTCILLREEIVFKLGKLLPRNKLS